VGAAPKLLRISSRNAAFQVFESLRTNRHKRLSLGKFLVEGVQPIERALADGGWPATDALIRTAPPPSRWAVDAIRRAAPERVFEVSAPLLGELSGKSESSELLLVLRRPPDDLARLPLRSDLMVVVCDRPSSPGNLGTTVRSCDSLGAHGVVTTGHGVDVYAPATITASRGSLFAVPTVQCASPADVAEWIGTVRETYPSLQVVGSDEQGSVVVEACDLTRPTILVCGNETTGRSRGWRELCDTIVRSPLGGSASSLNVGVSASIVLYERTRQLRAASAS
jgi:TrmH family RNA methyltransferase